jgi:Tfp pilus assembly protein PilN
MLSILKKKPEKAKSSIAPAWHTNYRNYAVLPDTKLVRTSFFASFACVTVASALLLAVVYQEYQLHFLATELEEVQAQSVRLGNPSAQAVAQYKKFRAEETRINEVNAFLKSQKLVLSDLLLQLGQTMPPGVALASIEYRDSGISLRGYAQGESSVAAVNASEYERQLKEDAKLNQAFPSITLVNLVRDQQNNKHLFEIVLSFGSAPKK